MPRSLPNVFTVTSFFDKARWSLKNNYNLINFCPSKLSDDDKLLTHLLCYITDRQMAFKRIWDIAGFIFSDLVYSVRKTNNLLLLNPFYSKSAFFIRSKDYAHYAASTDGLPDDDGYLFIGRHRVASNRTLLNYGFSSKTYPWFRSRFYPSDYKSMLFTLIILKDFHFSVVEYLKLILDHNMVKKPLIPRILFSLYLLTYYDNGSTSQRDIDFKALYNKGEKRKNDVMNIINNDLRFESELNTFSQDIIFKQKRAWCSLRDFFKSPEFSNYFFSSLKNHGFDRNSVLKQSGLLRQFELPGDVWNNNSTFRNCILTGTSYNKKSNEPFNRLLRNIYVEKNILVGYPEQFDITFDFVSRMCEDNNCDICPYGKDINKGDKLNKICHKDTSKYCSVVLACCGYRYHCNPINCELVKLKYV